jgi:hypothetical protein
MEIPSWKGRSDILRRSGWSLHPGTVSSLASRPHARRGMDRPDTSGPRSRKVAGTMGLATALVDRIARFDPTIPTRNRQGAQRTDADHLRTTLR